MSEEFYPRTTDAPRGIPILHAGIRFSLELAGLAGIAALGWHLGSGALIGGILAAAFSLAAGAIWAIFGVGGEAGRGDPVIAVPGWVRLTVEFAIFGISAYGIWVSWSRAASETFMTVTMLHYAVTWERSRWLLRGGSDRLEREEK